MEKQETFKVLGCGLPRTGTMSLQNAFQILYKGRCMHGFYWVKNSKEVNYVVDSIDDDKILKDFFEKNGYVGSTDAPFCFYYEKIMRLYPDAKFVLSIRNPETWVKSMKASVNMLAGCHSMFREFPYNFVLHTYAYLFDPSFYRWQLYTTKFKAFVELTDAVEYGQGIKYYEKWVDEVKSTIPKDKLLIFHVGEGWEPLCKFLELPVPDVPFPKLNDRIEMKRNVNFARFVSWTWLAGVFIAPVVASYYAVKYFEYW